MSTGREDCNPPQSTDRYEGNGDLVSRKTRAAWAGLLLSSAMLARAAGSRAVGFSIENSRRDSYFAPATFVAAALFVVSAGFTRGLRVIPESAYLPSWLGVGASMGGEGSV
jgi:hypothetical protein